MKKIKTHLWFNTQAKEASALYASLFPDSKIENVTTIKGTPSGDCDIVNFKLAGVDFMAISAGAPPAGGFTFNPSISLFAEFESEAEIQTVWNALVDGGKVLMEFATYPWARKYGWVQDKYGLSWQLSLSEHPVVGQKITPLLLFTESVAGKTKEALDFYTGIFPDSKIEMTVPYEKGEGEGDTEGFIKHARFTLHGQSFMAMDSSFKHGFTFNEAISFIVSCDSQEEIDHYWEALSAVPTAEQCGWLKDKYGVSWQIVPTVMNEMMGSGDTEKIARVTQAFLKMKKFDIATLQKAYQGE